jgi:hypothetical protein
VLRRSVSTLFCHLFFVRSPRFSRVLFNDTDDDMMGDTTPRPFTEHKCLSMLDQHCIVDHDLPYECKKYSTVFSELNRRNSNAKAFEGMDGAVKARASRANGRLTHPQIQRRLTHLDKKRLW